MPRSLSESLSVARRPMSGVFTQGLTTTETTFTGSEDGESLSGSVMQPGQASEMLKRFNGAVKEMTRK